MIAGYMLKLLKGKFKDGLPERRLYIMEVLLNVETNVVGGHW